MYSDFVEFKPPPGGKKGQSIFVAPPLVWPWPLGGGWALARPRRTADEAPGRAPVAAPVAAQVEPAGNWCAPRPTPSSGLAHRLQPMTPMQAEAWLWALRQSGATH